VEEALLELPQVLAELEGALVLSWIEAGEC
jgi:hypothetical protein